MPRTSTTTTKVAKTPSIESKALQADTKSEGMRMLYEAGYTVAQVAKVFGVGYPFAYGVAQRAGKVETAAHRRAVKAPKAPAAKAKVPVKAAAAKAPAKATKAAPKATAKAPAAKAETLTPGQKAYRARKARAAAAGLKPGSQAHEVVVKVAKAAPVKARATTASTAAKVAAKVAAKPGRPSPARRAANRAPRKANTVHVTA